MRYTTPSTCIWAIGSQWVNGKNIGFEEWFVWREIYTTPYHHQVPPKKVLTAKGLNEHARVFLGRRPVTAYHALALKILPLFVLSSMRFQVQSSIEEVSSRQLRFGIWSLVLGSLVCTHFGGLLSICSKFSKTFLPALRPLRAASGMRL
jgi:hypothetical protein